MRATHSTIPHPGQPNKRAGIRRRITLLASLGFMVVIVSLAAQQQRSELLIMEWVGNAKEPAPARAVLVEFGIDDKKPTTRQGQIKVEGATVAERIGYRFRAKDKLTGKDGFIVSSHRPLRLPGGKPALSFTEGISPAGVVLHLTDVKPGAKVVVTGAKNKSAEVDLDKVLAGQPQEFWNGKARVRMVSAATPIATGDTEDDCPAAAYAPDGSLWVAYIAYHVTEDRRRIEDMEIPEQPKDFKAYYTPNFGDQLLVKHFTQGKWSKPIAITDAAQDLVRCAIAVEKNGDVWAIYSAQRQGKHQLFARPISRRFDKSRLHTFKPGPEEKLSDQADWNFVNPVACTDSNGDIVVGCQTWRDKHTSIATFRCSEGKWSAGLKDLGFAGNNWHPSIAAGSTNTALAFDGYEGDYDIQAVSLQGNQAKTQCTLNSAKFEARPSLAFDKRGRLWMAYELGPDKWGKDFGALEESGNPLYFARTVRVVCIGDDVMEPVAALPPLGLPIDSPDTGRKVERLPRYSGVRICIDIHGRVWITYRIKFGTRYSSHCGSYWVTFARMLQGDRWSEPIEIHLSDGLLDERPVLLPHPAGGLRVIHNCDGRISTPNAVNNNLYMSYINLPGDAVEPKLVPYQAKPKTKAHLEEVASEREALKRIRAHRIEVGGKKYQLLRGEFHRHTEISWDGGPDGTLEDMFRYAVDAASMDWIGNGDHDNGAGREYSWWWTQKFTDAYHVPGRFTPMFSYERSVRYPHGHRNCIFARRGVRTLPRLGEKNPKERVAGIHADDTKMLYRYLHELNGICAVHTSATSMGTDWRDSDPVVEPIVEIYQGDRMSYEMEGAPRAGYPADSGKKPVNIAGWYPKGYVDLALNKGIKLGFQSSSDHFSTHISFCIVLAESHDREAIFDGLKNRRCYGATDNIILDVRSGPHLMGETFTTDKAPSLEFKVIGTAPLARVEVLKDSKVVKTFTPGKAEFASTWTDPDPAAGGHYYYIRVVQQDAEIAWGSPMWITYKR